jgi:electron transfer flavoprotein-quinone oxidoreductase
VVVSLEDLGARPPDAEGAHALLDAFKDRPEIRPLVEGGETVEYSAHLVPELAIEELPKRVTNGFLVAGDAAGFAINHGVTVRGMDLALASGVLAARACMHAKKSNDFSAGVLAEYDRLLERSFVLKDMRRHAGAPGFLRRRRLYDKYPKAMCDLMEEVFKVGPDGKARMFPAASRLIRRTFFGLSGMRDLWAARKL